MFLDYFALFLLCLSLTAVFYLFIYIHDLPHKIAKQREHPHEEAIHVAEWLALFTLEALWPLVFMWAVSHKKQPHLPEGLAVPPGMGGELHAKIAALEVRLQNLEGSAK